MRTSLMPYSYEIDKQHRLVITTATGVFTTEEVLDHAQRLKRDPDFFCAGSQ